MRAGGGGPRTVWALVDAQKIGGPGAACDRELVRK
jgi:hypothetical protein